MTLLLLFNHRDESGPLIQDLSPVPGAVNVPVVAAITGRIGNRGSGIDLSSLLIEISFDLGSTYAPMLTASVFSAGYSGSVPARSGGYDFLIAPATAFDRGAEIYVRISVSDAVGTGIVFVYSFTAGRGYGVAIIAGDNVLAKPLYGVAIDDPGGTGTFSLVWLRYDTLCTSARSVDSPNAGCVAFGVIATDSTGLKGNVKTFSLVMPYRITAALRLRIRTVRTTQVGHVSLGTPTGRIVYSASDTGGSVLATADGRTTSFADPDPNSQEDLIVLDLPNRTWEMGSRLDVAMQIEVVTASGVGGSGARFDLNSNQLQMEIDLYETFLTPLYLVAWDQPDPDGIMVPRSVLTAVGASVARSSANISDLSARTFDVCPTDAAGLVGNLAMWRLYVPISFTSAMRVRLRAERQSLAASSGSPTGRVVFTVRDTGSDLASAYGLTSSLSAAAPNYQEDLVTIAVPEHTWAAGSYFEIAMQIEIITPSGAGGSTATLAMSQDPETTDRELVAEIDL